jgi:hypothetical protein
MPFDEESDHITADKKSHGKIWSNAIIKPATPNPIFFSRWHIMPIIDKTIAENMPSHPTASVNQLNGSSVIINLIKIKIGIKAQINPARHNLLIGVCAGNT